MRKCKALKEISVHLEHGTIRQGNKNEWKLIPVHKLFRSDIIKDERKFLALLFFGGFVLRLVFIFVLRSYVNPETWENGYIADNIVSGKGFVIGFLGPEGASSWQAPFYPYFLAFFYLIFGRTSVAYLVIQIIQSIITSLVPVFLYKSANIIFNKEVARLTATLLVVFPLLIWYSTRIHHTAFVFFFISWIFYLFLKANETEKNLDFVYAGLALGIGVLVEPVMIVMFGAFGIWCWLRKGLRFSFAKYGFAFAIVFIIILPWTIRNYQVHGKIIFIKSSFGKELWMGNNPHATGTGFIEGGTGEITTVYPPPFLDELKNYPESVRNQMMLQEALRWIGENPSTFVSLTLKKAFYFWWYPPINVVRHIGGGESVKYELLKQLYWGVILISLVFGVLFALKNKNQYVSLIFLICLFWTIVYSLTHVGQQRFRGVIEPILFIFACYGIMVIVEKSRAFLRIGCK